MKIKTYSKNAIVVNSPKPSLSNEVMVYHDNLAVELKFENGRVNVQLYQVTDNTPDIIPVDTIVEVNGSGQVKLTVPDMECCCSQCICSGESENTELDSIFNEFIKKSEDNKNSLDELFDTIAKHEGSHVYNNPPKKVESNDLESLAASAGILDKDLVDGGMPEDTDEYEEDYLAGMKSGLFDKLQNVRPEYIAGDQGGADSAKHAKYIEGYINGYTE